jgi:hypothetical protein
MRCVVAKHSLVEDLADCSASYPQCAKSAKILQSFLADPNHPESALNSIPKEVLARAKG